jgi:hypothetical protein
MSLLVKHAPPQQRLLHKTPKDSVNISSRFTIYDKYVVRWRTVYQSSHNKCLKHVRFRHRKLNRFSLIYAYLRLFTLIYACIRLVAILEGEFTCRRMVSRSPPTQYSSTSHRWFCVSYLVFANQHPNSFIIIPIIKHTHAGLLDSFTIYWYSYWYSLTLFAQAMTPRR